jgi:hypothetical protein
MLYDKIKVIKTKCYIGSYQRFNMTKEFRSKISFRTFGFTLGGMKGSDSFFEIYTESW